MLCTLTPEAVDSLAERYEASTAEEIFRAATEQIPAITLACSFGAEDMVLLDMLSGVSRDVFVFYLDTEVLFPETYRLRDEVVARYRPNLIQMRPSLSIAEQAEAHGDALWSTDPDACCGLRKVAPLKQVLSRFDGWITGIRREQSPTRKGARAFETDRKFGLVKVNPLIRWTDEDVWAYIREHDVPYNPLHDQGYPSIGCIHCTRPVKPGEDPRSGRWAGKAKTECGLHA